jgi:UDP-N-acetylmuramoylalanine--D-glutamate ligase
MQPGNKLDSFVSFLREAFFQKTVLILGFGKEGQSTFRLLSKYLPEVNLLIADGNEKLTDLPILNDRNSSTLFFGDGYLDAIQQAEIVIKSPGVKLSASAESGQKHFTSQSDLFLKFYKGQVIGVTGTKGKSTTVSLIQHILTKAGKKSILLGNIGLPCFDKVPEIDETSIVVFEFSAHQLEFVTVSPHIAVLLNIFPEHLDYFNGVEAYRSAKMNIFKFQTEQDVLIVHQSLKHSLGKIKPKCLFFDAELKGLGGKLEIPLMGSHNVQNVVAAVMAAQQFGVTQREALKSLKDFKSLPHRLEFVGNFRGIDFYNDSISTIPESAIAAVKALKRVDTLILGGFDRGLDYSKLVSFLADSAISNYIFLGKAGEKIKKQMEQCKNNSVKLVSVTSLEDAFPVIVNNTKPGFVCLLSPAASSYDQFHNFEHRGDTYKSLAKSLITQ